MTAIRSRRYLDGSRGGHCTLRIPGVCTDDVATTVAAHIRDSHTGKSVKASDLSICDACAACHDRFDGRNGVLEREDWLFYALRALQATIERRVEQGLLVVSQDVVKRFAERPVKPRKPAAERGPIRGNSQIQSAPFPKQSRPLRSANTLRKSDRHHEEPTP